MPQTPAAVISHIVVDGFPSFVLQIWFFGHPYLVPSYLYFEVSLLILSHERYLRRIWIMSICPVHDVPVRSTVSWIRRGLAGSWPCFSGSVTSLVAGGLASGSTAAWLGLWGDVTHWAWRSPQPQQSATPLDTAGQACETPYMSQNQGNIMPKTK